MSRTIHRHLRNNGFIKDQDTERMVNPLTQFGLTEAEYLAKDHKSRYRIRKRLVGLGAHRLADHLKNLDHEKHRA